MTPDPAAAAVDERLDVLIVGAGLSGIGAACTLAARRPQDRYAILEARSASGGTWDLFRYPGIRSDSDMHTLGYRARPWTGAKAIADGPSILAYIRETAAAAGVDRHIRYDTRVVRADWSSEQALWTVEVDDSGITRRIACRFLFLCSGYYDYAAGHDPAFPGRERFAGRIVHPQHWPADLDVAGRRVAVIGSGATAMTLVPALAATAAHVTMIQRSPTYVVARPARDRLADALARRLPARLAYRLTRLKNILLGMAVYRFARRRPQAMARRLIAMVAAELPGHDVARDFTPRYAPWDQRLCLVPDGDLFAALRSGRASVRTDAVTGFTETGVATASGGQVDADIVVTATGLRILLFGGIALHVDGTAIDPGGLVAYRGMMFGGVPNLALAFGYTNASWTLKSDLTADYVCRLLDRMERTAAPICVPCPNGNIGTAPFVDFSSGYITRAAADLPRQGLRPPWRLHQSYWRDLLSLRYGRIADGAMTFPRRRARP